VGNKQRINSGPLEKSTKREKEKRRSFWPVGTYSNQRTDLRDSGGKTIKSLRKKETEIKDQIYEGQLRKRGRFFRECEKFRIRGSREGSDLV